MKYINIKCFMLISLFFLTSCDKKEELYLPAKSYKLADERLWPYFQNFEEEAKARNLIIDLNLLKIKGTIEVIHAPNITGLCNHEYQGGNQIILDQHFWSRASTLEKEAIVFHEIGHCVLFQNHRNEAFKNGMCKSLMRSGFSQCITFYRENRSYYLDELMEK